MTDSLQRPFPLVATVNKVHKPMLLGNGMIGYHSFVEFELSSDQVIEKYGRVLRIVGNKRDK